MRRDPISTRARLALNRLSRNRWISGDECSKIVRRWVKNANAYKSVMCDGVIDQVGIIHGYPPAFPFEKHYGEIRKCIRSGKSDVEIMIKLLSILLRIQNENIWRSKNGISKMFHAG